MRMRRAECGEQIAQPLRGPQPAHGQSTADRGEVQDLVIKIGQTLPNPLPDLSLRPTAILKLQQFGDVVERETQGLGLADELQTFNVVPEIVCKCCTQCISNN